MSYENSKRHSPKSSSSIDWTGEWTEEHWQKLEQDLDSAYAIYGEELARTDHEVMTSSHIDFWNAYSTP